MRLRRLTLGAWLFVGVIFLALIGITWALIVVIYGL